MDHIIADISRQSSLVDKVLHEQSQLVIKQLKEGGQSLELVQEAKLVLHLAKSCIEWTGAADKKHGDKVPSLGTKLLSFYIRHLADISSVETCVAYDQLIQEIIDTIESIVVQPEHIVRPEVLAVLVDLTTSFATHMTLQHVINIIHLCALEVRNYFRSLSGSTKHSMSSSVSSSTSLTHLKLFSFEWNFSKSVLTNTKKAMARKLNLNLGGADLGDDKTLATICLVAGQVCHFYVKQNICRSARSTRSTTSSSTSSSANASMSLHRQDLTHLLLYLSKKLETRLSFYYEASQHSQQQQREESGPENTASCPRVELFSQLKLVNCYHLKCLHYTLLTIPDAWRAMTSNIMDVVSRHLAPPLVALITPNTLRSAEDAAAGSARRNEHAGRGAQSVLGLCFDDELFEQERQLVYKISAELLRLFGLEETMRPLLEALFYRMFLLPPLAQRTRAFVYMQDMLKNSLLVTLLISDPVCLFGRSHSRSSPFGLLQLLLDSINEALTEPAATNTVTAQQALICWATLFTSLQNILVMADKGGTMLSSPTVAKLLAHVARDIDNYQRLVSLKAKETGQVSTGQTTLPAGGGEDFKIVDIEGRVYGDDKEAKHSERGTDELSTYHRCLFALVTQNSSGESNEFAGQTLLNAQPRRFNSADNLAESSVDYLSGFRRHIHKNYSDGCLKGRRGKLAGSHLGLHRAGEESSEDEDTSVFESVSEDRQHFPGRQSGDRKNTDMTEEVEDSDEDFHDLEDEPMIDAKNEVLFRRAPKTIFGDLCATSHDLASIAHLERSIGRIFGRHLHAKQEEWATNSKTMTIVRLDEEMQRFASEFCTLLYQKLSNFQAFEAEKEDMLGLSRSERQMFVRHQKIFEDLFINADGIYLTAYQAFALSFRLYRAGYYLGRERSKITTSESQFVEAVLDHGGNIYLSYAFLAEVYQQVLAVNFIQPYLEGKTMLQLLEDIELSDAQRSLQVGALSDYARLQRIAGSVSRSISDVSIVSLETIDEREDLCGSEPENKKMEPSQLQRQCLRLLVRRACHYFWTTFLVSMELRLGARSADTFARLVDTMDNVTYTASAMKVLGVRNRKQLAQLTLLDECIELLGQLLRLSLRVDYLDRMHTLYELFLHFLVRLSPSDKAFSVSPSSPPSTMSSSPARSFLRLTPVQADVVKTFLVFASKVGAHQANIWPTYFELARFLSQHETMLFRSTRSNLFSRARVSINSMLRSNSFSTGLGGVAATSSTASTRAHQMSSSHNFESMYDFSTLPGVHEAQSQSLESEFDRLVSSWRQEQSSNSGGGQRLLDEYEMETVLEYLNNFALISFETVAVHYNLESMLTFVRHLIDYSATQLTELRPKTKSNTLASTTSSLLDTKTAAFTRLIEVVLRFVRTGRPLIHFLRLWPLVSSHLVFAVGIALNEPALMKRILSAMHDIINAALTMYSELDFFHFNEMIFALYERLMWWEVVGEETADAGRHSSAMLSMQEMLLSSICEFAEGANAEIRSGWRAIFRAMRAFRLLLPSEEQHDGTALSMVEVTRTRTNKDTEDEANQHGCSPRMDLLADILNAYLAGTNSHAFAHASVDYIQCLLHLMKTNIVGTALCEETRQHDQLDALLVVFLKYLQRFAKLLREKARRSVPGEINFSMAPNVRRRRVRWVDVDRLRAAIERDLADDQHCQFSFNLNLPQLNENVESSNTGTARLWALLLEEFAGTILDSLVEHRQMQMEVFMALLEMTPDIVDGQADEDNLHFFTLQCYNQIVLPVMQDFLRQSLRPLERENTLSSKTHLEQLYTFYNTWLKAFNEKIISLMLQLHRNETTTMDTALSVLFKQTLLVYLECFTPDYDELVKVVAMSSLRILLTSLCPTLTSTAHWEVMIDCFKLGHYLTLCPLRRLLDCLEGVPFNFGAEFARIKILTTRSDRTATESMRRLARRVFVVHVDINNNNLVSSEDVEKARLASKPARLEDNRIYTIIVETDTGVKKSFHCNELVAQLYLHLAWLQTFGDTLTSDLSCRLEDIIGFFGGYHNNAADEHPTRGASSRSMASTTLSRLSLLTLDQFDQVISLLADSFQAACQFDRRTGLKFLLQYVAEIGQPANLYFMTALAWACRFCLAYQLDSIQTLDPLDQSDDSMQLKTCSLETILDEMITFYAQHHGRLDVEQVVRARLKSQQSRPLPSELFILIALGKENAQQVLSEVEKNEQDRKSGEWKTQLEDCGVSQLIPSGLMTTDFRTAKHKLLKTHKQKIDVGGNSNTSNTVASEYFQLDELLCLRLLNEMISRCVQASLHAHEEVFRRSSRRFQKLVNFSIEHPVPALAVGECDQEGKDPRVESIQLWIDRLVKMITQSDTHKQGN